MLTLVHVCFGMHYCPRIHTLLALFAGRLVDFGVKPLPPRVTGVSTPAERRWIKAFGRHLL